VTVRIEMNAHPAGSTGPGAPDPADRDVGERAAEVGWPVGVVAERLGIAAPTLRSWDRRHGVGPSVRTSGNHRRYTELDIRRVELMSRLTAQGVPAQSAAESVLALGVDGLGQEPAAASPSEQDATDLVEALVGAASALDAGTLSLLLRGVLRRRDAGQAWVEVFAPALRRVGDLWQEGRVGVQAEHLTSELIQSELRAVVRDHRLRVAGLPVVLAGADDELHHLPLIALEAELARNGVASLFLGPRVPADALISALRQSRPRAVFLWASLPRPRDEPFWRQLEVVDWPLEVVIGGPGWAGALAAPDGPVVVRRVDDFRAAVRALVPTPAG